MMDSVTKMKIKKRMKRMEFAKRIRLHQIFLVSFDLSFLFVFILSIFRLFYSDFH